MTVSMIDTKWGRLTVLERAEKETSDKLIHYVCRCNCGNTVVIKGSRLRKGETTSCGCFARELTSKRSSIINRSHGMTHSREYNSWQSMKTRCYNPKSPNWKYYGGKGIIVCDQWMLSFEVFLEDMGFRPEGMTLDRIDSNGNYEPSNCRWATAKEQIDNRSFRFEEF